VILVQSLFTPRVVAQQMSVQARLDSSTFFVGDPIVVRLTLRHSAGVSVQPLVGDTVGGFTVLGKTDLARESDSITTMTLTVAKYDSAQAEIPPVPFMYFTPGDTAQRYAFSNSLLVTVTTVPLDTTGEIRDVKPPLAIPIPIEELLLYVAIVLVLGVVGYLGYRWWRRRKQAPAGGVEEAPRKPAHVLALEELGALKEKRLWQQGMVKQYYSEVTEILRRYVENRYAQPALEETTDEILQGLRAQDLPPDLLESCEGLLRRADLVKFARYVPGMGDHETTLQGAYTFVERTREVRMTPAESGEGSHVGS
jgi:hypothetical protein